VGTGYRVTDIGLPRAEAAAHAVARARAVRSVGRPRPPDLVILTGTAAWDPTAALRLVTRRVPHLAVRARETTTVVGPLVLPGRTSCLRCADLHRTDVDPAWPRVAAQLYARPPRNSVTGAQLAAGLAAEHALAHLTGTHRQPDDHPAAGATLELDPAAGTLVRRSWPAHPRCNCGTLGTPVLSALPAPGPLTTAAAA
ncbi:MAG TPA: TOMM precursor leader peptide-binding protein, partial [Pseudonocardiaceae bacterium]